MRYPLIAIVLLATGGTFYSALTFQSAQIEADISERVTRELVSSGAKDIGVDVDGRHVTLSGVVYDQQTETAYLETVSATEGALGPIDGLTFTNDMGFVTAIKTADGITLRGTVPNEDVRADLVFKAGEATGGKIDDQLIIAGPDAAWHSEASFGLTHLAALTTGTLSATDGAYSLSGMAKEGGAKVQTALADRDGWHAFIAAPEGSDSAKAELARLSQELEKRDQNLTALNTLMATLNKGKADLTNQLELTTQRATDATAAVDSLTSEAEAKAAEATALSARIEELEQALATRSSDLASDGAQVVALRTELDTKSKALADANEAQATLASELEALNASLSTRDTEIADLTSQLATFETDAKALSTDLELRDATIAELKSEMGTLETDLAVFSDVNGVIAERETTIAELTRSLATSNAELATLTERYSDRDGTQAFAAAQIEKLEADADGLEARVDDLVAVVATRDTTIEELQNQATSTASLATQCDAQVRAVMEDEGINFRTGTAALDTQSAALMERLTGLALACVGENLGVLIGGHTDDRGSDVSNQSLSEQRAQAVLTFMSERGVPSDALQATGYGETQPIADNGTAAGRASNRRISFEWQVR